MDPLLTLRSLTTDVEHPVGEITDDEGRLGNTGRLDTRPQDILIVGHVVGRSNASNVIEVAASLVSFCAQPLVELSDLLSGRIVELVLSRALEALLDTTVFPQSLDGVSDLGRKDIALDLGGLHEDGLDVVLHPLVLQRQLQGLHGLQDDAHGLDRVAEDDFLERLSFVAGVATLVDELHLLEDGRLSGFTSTCQFCQRKNGRSNRTTAIKFSRRKRRREYQHGSGINR